jgi:hypothetical protein
MPRSIRRNEINARRTRRRHLKKLRARFAKAKTSADKEKILAKVARVAPGVSPEQFVAPIKTA